MTTKTCTLSEAAEMVERSNPKTDAERSAIIARISYSTGWSIAAIEGELDWQWRQWCADHGYDYT